MADLRALLAHNAVRDGVQVPSTQVDDIIIDALATWVEKTFQVYPMMGGGAMSWNARGIAYSIIICPGRALLMATKGYYQAACVNYDMTDPCFPGNLQDRLLQLYNTPEIDTCY